MHTTKVLETFDSYLAAYLDLQGIAPKLKITNGKVVFAFAGIDEVYRAIGAFNANERVPVADFVTRTKIPRGKMLSLKGSAFENGKGKQNGKKGCKQTPALCSTDMEDAH